MDFLGPVTKVARMAERSHVAGRIPYNIDVLRWARERSNCAIEDAARRVNVSPDRITEWEMGDAAPTVRQARMLAALYDRPFLEFFARDVPDVPDTELVPDFRFHREGPSSGETAALKAIQQWAEEQRLNAIDLLEMIGEPAPKIDSHLFATLEDDVEAVSARVREVIGFLPAPQSVLRASDRDKYPGYLRHVLERTGILVLRQSGLGRLRARGLCLFADPLPVIVFGSEAPGAQAFTLAHEFAHVVLRQSAISGTPRFGHTKGHKRIEGWCNRFAAAFLMPRDLISAEVGDVAAPMDAIDDDHLGQLSNRYAVSRHAMLIRLVNLGYVKPTYYWFTKRPQFLREEEDFEPRGRPPYYGSRYRSSRGDFYTGLVLEAWTSGRITNHNAAEFMGIKNLSHLNDIRTHFGV